MASSMLAVVLMLCAASPVLATSPSKYINFQLQNRMRDTGLPLSYWTPLDYFESVPESERYVPEDQKPQPRPTPTPEPVCNNKVILEPEMDKYKFQSEQFLTTLGSSTYDAAVWAISLAASAAADAGSHIDVAQRYINEVLVAHKTAQFNNIRGDAVCGGLYEEGCSVGCGFCYGDSKDAAQMSLPTDNAFFFRMISDVYALEGTLDARCPEMGGPWVWNDWKPVLGENAWANLLGPLQVEWANAGGDVTKIPDDSAGMRLATQMLPAIEKMHISSVGCVHYAPHNTYSDDRMAGHQVSIENQVSLLAGLKALHHIIASKSSSTHRGLLLQLQQLMDDVHRCIYHSYDHNFGYFLQGGQQNRTTGAFNWHPSAASDVFAVDCQTWLVTVVGAEMIDGWFGEGTALRLWQTTKKIGGYSCDDQMHCKGVGFSVNSDDQVFSGEWSLGALNMLRTMAASGVYDATTSAELLSEADTIRAAIDAELQTDVTFDREAPAPEMQGASSKAVLYANKRYFIPFGWWANPLPSLASTSWALLADLNFNPFLLGGAYHSSYWNTPSPEFSTTAAVVTTTQTSSSSSTRTTATTTTTVYTGPCSDIPGWTDKDGDVCSTYVANGYCHASWQPSYAGPDGRTADDACCKCGGGLKGDQTLPPSTTPSTSTTTSSFECTDVANWRTSIGLTCSLCSRYPGSYCAREDQIAQGMNPSQACCACGGGIAPDRPTTTTTQVATTTLRTCAASASYTYIDGSCGSQCNAGRCGSCDMGGVWQGWLEGKKYTVGVRHSGDSDHWTPCPDPTGPSMCYRSGTLEGWDLASGLQLFSLPLQYEDNYNHRVSGPEPQGWLHSSSSSMPATWYGSIGSCNQDLECSAICSIKVMGQEGRKPQFALQRLTMCRDWTFPSDTTAAATTKAITTTQTTTPVTTSKPTTPAAGPVTTPVTTSKPTTPAAGPVTTKGSTTSSHMCVTAPGQCPANSEWDSQCFRGGLGCAAGGRDCCRFCGFGAFTACGGSPPITAASTTSKAATTTRATTTASTGSNQCVATASQCPNQSEWEPSCFGGGLGCMAGGHDCCRFCGFAHFPACNSATSGLTIQHASAIQTPTMVAGGAIAAMVLVVAVVAAMWRGKRTVVAEGLQESLL